MMRPEVQLAEPGAKQLVLGLALLFLGKQDAVEATLEVRAPQGRGWTRVLGQDPGFRSPAPAPARPASSGRAGLSARVWAQDVGRNPEWEARVLEF